MFNLRRYVDFIIPDDPVAESLSDSMESMEDATSGRSIRMRNFTRSESDYLLMIKSNQLFKITSLKKTKYRRSFQKAGRTYLMSCLLSLSSPNENTKPGHRQNHSLESLLNFLKRHKLRIVLKLNSRDFRRIFSLSKQGPLLNRLLKHSQIKLMTTIQTPKLLWRRSKINFIRFWKLNLPLSVTRARRKTEILRGINRNLFVKIATSRPLILCRLLKRPEINRALAIEWAEQLENRQIINQLQKV